MNRSAAHTGRDHLRRNTRLPERYRTEKIVIETRRAPTVSSVLPAQAMEADEEMGELTEIFNEIDAKDDDSEDLDDRGKYSDDDQNPRRQESALDEELGCEDVQALAYSLNSPEWDDLSQANQQHILAFLSRHMTFLEACQRLQLTHAQATTFVNWYNADVKEYKRMRKRIAEGNKLKNSFFNNGPTYDKGRWNKISEWQYGINCKFKTMFLPRRDAIYVYKFLLKFDFINHFNKGRTPQENKLLEQMKRWGVDFKWHGIYMGGPNGVSGPDPDEEEPEPAPAFTPEPPKKSGNKKVNPGTKKRGGKRYKEKMAARESLLRHVMNVSDLAEPAEEVEERGEKIGEYEEMEE